MFGEPSLNIISPCHEKGTPKLRTVLYEVNKSTKQIMQLWNLQNECAKSSKMKMSRTRIRIWASAAQNTRFGTQTVWKHGVVLMQSIYLCMSWGWSILNLRRKYPASDLPVTMTEPYIYLSCKYTGVNPLTPKTNWQGRSNLMNNVLYNKSSGTLYF